MRCPTCEASDNYVVDTRSSRGGRAIRRRRECASCGARFTTYEVPEERPIQVLKRDGSVEEFDRRKLLESISVACAKRPVSATALDEILNGIEDRLSRRSELEVPSAQIGELVMEGLKPLDHVAYVRYASVYRNFQDIDEFQDMVDELHARRLEELRAREQVELPF